MKSKEKIDNLLSSYADDLFWGPVRFKRGKTKAMIKAHPVRRHTPAAARAKLSATIRKVPEVNVKITGTSSNMSRLKAHFDYISKRGQLTLEDQDGELISGPEGVGYLRQVWRDSGHVIPETEGRYREAFHITLSMPPGTNRRAVHEASRDFAKDLFPKSDYIFVSHTNTGHPHVHLVVKAKDADGRRLNPRKQDLQKWRETFATKLKEHGIEANATKRQARGVYQYPVPKQVIAAERAGRKLPIREANQRKRKNKPLPQKVFDTHAKVIGTYRRIGTALAESADVSDRRLAVRMLDFIRDMPLQSVITKEKTKDKGKDKGRGVERSDPE